MPGVLRPIPEGLSPDFPSPMLSYVRRRHVRQCNPGDLSMHDIILIGLIFVTSMAATITGDEYVLGMNSSQIVLFFSSMMLAKTIANHIRKSR